MEIGKNSFRGLWLAIFMLGLVISATAQGGVHKNMVRTQGTFGLGSNFQEWKYYLQGDLGFMASDLIEVNGAIYVNLGSSQEDVPDIFVQQPNNLQAADYYTHSMFFGPRFHFLADQSLDLFASIQPGITLINVSEASISGIAGPVVVEPEHWGIAPNFSVGGGIAWYGSFFHLFGETRLVAGSYHDKSYSIPLNEIRIAFGLGFNFN